MIQLPTWTPIYRELIRKRADELNSDGCTMVPDFYVDACYEHDIHFRTHQTLFGVPILFEEANHWFGERIKTMSPFGRFSPMAWWRERAVSKFGRKAWDAEGVGTPFCQVYQSSWVKT